MSDINLTVLSGRLGNRPELRYTSSGRAFCSFSVASNRFFKKGDETVQRATWTRWTAWGKNAETIAANTDKGKRVEVKGHVTSREYLDPKTNTNRQVTEFEVEEINFVDRLPKAQPQVEDTPEAPETSPASLDDMEIPV